MTLQRGFTLIEMMIVVAIIAILAALLIPNFTHARAQAQTAACEANLRTIATALELYYTDNQRYPAAGSYTVGASGASADALTSGGYLNSVPHDPAAPAGASNLYTYTTVDQSATQQNGYDIKCPGTHDPSTLKQLPHWTSNSSTLYFNSGSGLDTRANP